VRRNALLIATVIAALAFLLWLGWATPGGLHNPPASSPELPAGVATGPAAAASGFARAPVIPAPETRSEQAPQPGPATSTSAPPEVQEATERRQTAKITRGMSSSPEGGIRIDATPPGSVAGEMHLLPGDVLMSVNGAAVSSPEEFARLYRSGGVQGEYVVIRGGREIHRR
jgi:S1-C subfamily serine protease